jgi:hypothetical protein
MVAMVRVVLFVSALAACKSPGTITLDFDLDGSACAAFGSGSAAIDHYVLYAEPDTSCASCGCGACAGSHPAVLICPSSNGAECTRATFADQAIALDPGIWAVVLEAYSSGAGSSASLLASQCIDVEIDHDGQMGGTAAPGSDGSSACD